MEPRGSELINRYKLNYFIAPEAEVTEEMILAHWELEKELTTKLLETTPENRWEVFEQSYSTLYSQLEWLNRLSGQTNAKPSIDKYTIWIETIGSPPKKIYEIGSGKGEMIAYLAKSGFECKGTEITRERGKKHLSGSLPNLSWGNSDGVHLNQFEQPETYDVVLSDQVIEHLHPDDLIAHLKGSYNILTPNGRYIFRTPHCYTGPHDVSIVFKCDRPKGMHLKEYTYRELLKAIKSAGFRVIYCPIPPKVRKLLSKIGFKNELDLIPFGILYLILMLFIEKIIALISNQKIRRFIAKNLKKFLLFRDNIFLVSQK